MNTLNIYNQKIHKLCIVSCVYVVKIIYILPYLTITTDLPTSHSSI